MSLVTLDQAKAHLRITTTVEDADLTERLAHAEAAILDYIGTTQFWRDAIATWDVSTVPPFVVASILLEFGELYRLRGDDEAYRFGPLARTSPSEDLSPQIIGLLRRTRDPVIV